MIGRNINYYRIMAGKSEKELSQELGVSRKCLQKYENGEEIPDLKTTRMIAEVLGVRFAELMVSKSTGHKYEHCEYRKNVSFRKRGQEYVKRSVEDCLDRFFAIVDILGGKVLREVPKIHELKPTFDEEEDARKLRKRLGFALSGAISNLISSLEDKGILIIQLEYEDDKFSGMNGLADLRPYIVVNSLMTAERQRSTIVHELVHVFFELPAEESAKWERYVTSVSGAFLLPREDAFNELGAKRKGISSDMLMVCREYGISLQMLAKRASQNRIISDEAYRSFNIILSRSGMKKHEPSRIAPETTELFEQLVLRAVGEEKITVQRGAELLNIPYTEMAVKICPAEMTAWN